MQNSIRFRTAELTDAESIARLHARSWRQHYRGEFLESFLDRDLVGERLAVWRERLDRPPEGQLVELAIDANTLLGFVCVYAFHDPEWGALVDNLHVAEAAKRRGVGGDRDYRLRSWRGSDNAASVKPS